MTRTRKPPTLEQRANSLGRWVATHSDNPNEWSAEALARNLFLPALRAAVRAERKACEQLCREASGTLRAIEKEDAATGGLLMSGLHAVCAQTAEELADRIKRRPKP